MKSDLHCTREPAEGREGEEAARDSLCKVSIARERDKSVKELGCKWKVEKGGRERV